ncbi:YlbL family protein [Lapillicoccus jejuensis]|uniref:endopeptidase La n=1 Tax=Lapillicoccus jejuensis TaxID=402171 RepID=A0A542DW34_9MICO|nr:S16 family serine protease [Lapillicoccus jejuensis]TQJ07310.1 PDZ domain-containing protein [Lapillicoccus jejuensis]
MTTSTTPPPPVPPGEPVSPYDDPAGAPPPTPKASRGAVALLVAVFIGLLVGAAANLVHLPYAVMSPGPATNVLGATGGGEDGKARLITVAGRQTYADGGALDFTTVRVQGGPGYPVSVWDVVQAWLSPTQDVYPVDAIFPPSQSQQDVTAENQAEMTGSQEIATAVALRHLGITVPEQVTVGRVAKDAPSGDALQVGDVVTSVGGVKVTSTDALRAAIQKAKPGAVLAVGVTRGGTPTTVQARTGASDGRTVLGINLGVTYDFPFKVTIDAGDVGGPSAGLMFSLGLYDLLTPGSLTGGQKVAGTGTIAADGTVGPIGGIRQKMAGAREAGATWFLAPKDNCSEVVGHVPDGMTAVKVDTFDDAEAAVTAIGENEVASLPHC